MCHWCSYHILTSSVIYLLSKHTATWNLFVLYNKKKTHNFSFLFKIFLNYLKAGLCPLWRTQKQAIWRNLLSIQHETISLSLYAITRNCDWSRKITPLSNGFLWKENLQQKQNWTAKSTSVNENTGKINSVFVLRAALWAEKLECFYEYCWSWKNTLGKHAVAVNTRHHLIRVLNKRRVTDGGNLCPLWLVILKFVWDGIGDTLWLQCSWPWAVVRYTFLTVVPWNGLEHSYLKVRLCVYFNWL